MGPQLTCHSDTLRELNTLTYLRTTSTYIGRVQEQEESSSSQNRMRLKPGIVLCCAALHGAPYIELRSRYVPRRAVPALLDSGLVGLKLTPTLCSLRRSSITLQMIP